LRPCSEPSPATTLPCTTIPLRGAG